MTLQTVYDDTEERMMKTVDHFEEELRGVRTGRASSGLVENIKIEYYGAQTPLNQVGNISLPEPRLIVIKPFDSTVLPTIEKALIASDLGITPLNDGKLIRLNIPPLTEDRRKQIVVMIKKMAETARVSIRNIRRDANKEIEVLEKKDKSISEDESTKGKDEVQKMTADYEKKINEVLDKKTNEVMEV